MTDIPWFSFSSFGPHLFGLSFPTTGSFTSHRHVTFFSSQEGRPPAVLSRCSRVRLFETPWTVAHQAPLSMDSPGKNTAVRCHFLPQGIFPTQGSNRYLLHCRHILYLLSHPGSSFSCRCCCCCCYIDSVVSNSVRPHRRQPTRLPCPWDSPGKNTGVGCHFLLQFVK